MGKLNEVQEQTTQSFGSNAFTTTVKENTIEFDSAKNSFTFVDPIEAPALTINGQEVVPQVQADWNQNDNTKADFIKNKPTISEQLQADWNQDDSTAKDYIKNKPVLGGVQFKIEGTPAVLKASLDNGLTWQTVTLS